MTEPTIKFSPQDQRVKQSIWLQDYRKNVVTKYGEDGLIEKIFEVIGTQNKFLCDVGAADGKHHSNSYNLLVNKEWKGILFEPTKQRYKELKELYRENKQILTRYDFVGLDKHNDLDFHLDQLENKVPQNFDFLSIDIDGCDVHIWKDIKRYRPRVVCIEFNPCISLDIYFLQARDLSVNQGNSLLAICEEAKDMGYELIATTQLNAFFVERSEFQKFKITDNSPKAMHFLEDKATHILMTYDGHLFLAGRTHHPWKHFELREESIQVLPPEYQKWKADGRLSFATQNKQKVRIEAAI
ncbi:FkbM family methyltransferase [Pseudovibrio brasiliensis]|uniref:Methyltransferase FkbM domain-containing protein n=1 Tax=Pseudovibrio brasiliensis TaxID=1898042 RepID=A0ABX8AI07_9HYPH|nr:FkbM family methyltransferase [Pseudovibrio brasiliensis]QUS54710.1 hypothetical protein KGB56_15120 [Pseudovibrio brasiliensis]